MTVTEVVVSSTIRYDYETSVVRAFYKNLLFSYDLVKQRERTDIQITRWEQQTGETFQFSSKTGYKMAVWWQRGSNV